jgi:DNA-binding LacI/PurR family transcriptional regulator
VTCGGAAGVYLTAPSHVGGNAPESALVLPQVATIARPIQEMCRHVVRMLLELLAGRGRTN